MESKRDNRDSDLTIYQIRDVHSYHESRKSKDSRSYMDVGLSLGYKKCLLILSMSLRGVLPSNAVFDEWSGSPHDMELPRLLLKETRSHFGQTFFCVDSKSLHGLKSRDTILGDNGTIETTCILKRRKNIEKCRNEEYNSRIKVVGYRYR